MADASSVPVAPAPRRQRWFGLAHLVIFGAGIGFFVLSFVALGVLPGLRLEREMDGLTQVGDKPYTDAELRGRRT